MNAKSTRRQQVTYFGRAALVWEYRSNPKNRHSLRVSVTQWGDTGVMEAKVIEGDGRKRNCVEYVAQHVVTDEELTALVKEWIG